MDRRKFLLGVAGVGAAGVVAAKTTDRFCKVAAVPDGIALTSMYHRMVDDPDIEGTLFTETYRGIKIEFERYRTSWDGDNYVYSVWSRFTVSNGPKTTYALGKIQTREMREDGVDMTPYIDKLRKAMHNTIDIYKFRDGDAIFPNYVHTAPMKPEGSPRALI